MQPLLCQFSNTSLSQRRLSLESFFLLWVLKNQLMHFGDKNEKNLTNLFQRELDVQQILKAVTQL